MPWDKTKASVADQIHIMWGFIGLLPNDSLCLRKCKEMIHKLLDDGRNMDDATVDTLAWAVDAYPEEYLFLLRSLNLPPTDEHFQSICLITARCLRSQREEMETLKLRILELETAAAERSDFIQVAKDMLESRSRGPR